MVLEECEILVLSLLFKSLLCCSNSAANFFILFKTCLMMVKSLHPMVLEVVDFFGFYTFQDLLALICMQPMSLHIVNSISTLCHFVSTSVLPCNNIFCIGMVADHILINTPKALLCF